MPLPYTTDSFITKAKTVHGDTYRYDQTVYVHSRKKVKIFCKKCNEYFEQIAGLHISGHGCQKCWRPGAWEKTGNKARMSQEEFINKARAIYGDRYDYSKVIYTGNKNNVTIICSIHGEFESNAGNFIHGHDCYKCSMIENGNHKNEIAKKTFLERARKIHGNDYEYLSEYESAFKKMKMRCTKCGRIFYQTPSNHLHVNGYGCQLCKTSKGELQIEKFLLEKNISFIREARFNDCVGYRQTLPFDFYLPKYHTCIEYDGIQHTVITGFGSTDPEKIFKTLKFNDAIKNKYCQTNKISLIRIPYTDFDNIKNILTEKLNITDDTALNTILNY
jgi:hypothetical protein